MTIIWLESCSQVVRIMMLFRLMSDCPRSDSREFADRANFFSAEPLYPVIQQDLTGLFTAIQAASDLNPGSTGLRGEQSLNPLRT